MPAIRVGLASQTRAATFEQITRVARALHTQVRRDLAPIWDVEASVEPVPDPANVPHGMLPIFVVDDTPHHVGGLQTDDEGRPFAVVLASRDWGLAASHECIEMLIDPTGNRMQDGLALAVDAHGTVVDGADRVRYLVEACDPMEDPAHAYTIHGVPVADFYTPDYFDDTCRPGVRYSHRGVVLRPREVKPNGYVSWLHPGVGRLQQLRWFENGPVLRDLPDHALATTEQGLSHRAFVDRHTVTPRQRRSAAPPAAA